MTSFEKIEEDGVDGDFHVPDEEIEMSGGLMSEEEELQKQRDEDFLKKASQGVVANETLPPISRDGKAQFKKAA